MLPLTTLVNPTQVDFVMDVDHPDDEVPVPTDIPSSPQPEEEVLSEVDYNYEECHPTSPVDPEEEPADSVPVAVASSVPVEVASSPTSGAAVSIGTDPRYYRAPPREVSVSPHGMVDRPLSEHVSHLPPKVSRPPGMPPMMPLRLPAALANRDVELLREASQAVMGVAGRDVHEAGGDLAKSVSSVANTPRGARYRKPFHWEHTGLGCAEPFSCFTKGPDGDLCITDHFGFSRRGSR